MGAAAYVGRGFKGRVAVSGERPIGAAGCTQQHNQVACHGGQPISPIATANRSINQSAAIAQGACFRLCPVLVTVPHSLI